MFKFQLPIFRGADLFPNVMYAPTAVRMNIITPDRVAESEQQEVATEAMRIVDANRSFLSGAYLGLRQRHDLSGQNYMKVSRPFPGGDMTLSINFGQEILTLNVYPQVTFAVPVEETSVPVWVIVDIVQPLVSAGYNNDTDEPAYVYSYVATVRSSGGGFRFGVDHEEAFGPRINPYTGQEYSGADDAESVFGDFSFWLGPAFENNPQPPGTQFYPMLFAEFYEGQEIFRRPQLNFWQVARFVIKSDFIQGIALTCDLAVALNSLGNPVKNRDYVDVSVRAWLVQGPDTLREALLKSAKEVYTESTTMPPIATTVSSVGGRILATGRQSFNSSGLPIWLDIPGTGTVRAAPPFARVTASSGTVEVTAI